MWTPGIFWTFFRQFVILASIQNICRLNEWIYTHMIWRQALWIKFYVSKTYYSSIHGIGASTPMLELDFFIKRKHKQTMKETKSIHTRSLPQRNGTSHISHLHPFTRMHRDQPCHPIIWDSFTTHTPRDPVEQNHQRVVVRPKPSRHRKPHACLAPKLNYTHDDTMINLINLGTIGSTSTAGTNGEPNPISLAIN
jgi:hypothetical protein